MSNENNNDETIHVKSKSYTTWTMIKLVLFGMACTMIFNFFSYLNVGMNHAYAKFIGVASDFVAICKACLDSLG